MTLAMRSELRSRHSILPQDRPLRFHLGLVSVLGIACALAGGYATYSLYRTDITRPSSKAQAQRESVRPSSVEPSPMPAPLRLQGLPQPVPGPSALPEQAAIESGEAGEPLPDSPEAMRTSLEATYEMEAVDRAWAAPAETTLSTHLQAVLPERSRLMSARCRESMCELRIEHAEPDGHDALTRVLGNARPWPGAIYISAPKAGVDGGAESVLYIAREGRPLVGIAE